MMSGFFRFINDQEFINLSRAFIVMIAVFVQVLVYQIKTKSAQTPLPSFVILSHAHLDFLDLLRF